MYAIIRTYRQSMPAVRFIGRRYGDEDRHDGGFGRQWDEWFKNGWFGLIEQAAGGEKACHDLYEDGDAYLGLMRYRDDEPFSYWIGLFTPPETVVPAGFASIDFAPADLGVVWLRGPIHELFKHEDDCARSCAENRMQVKPDGQGAYWFFERYGCPRFTTPDANDHVTLDICHFIESESA